jgi:2-polyprenyl-3-methyl-5-hydroxy-6-metoxy-1,4-benzoquinol methylase
MPSKWTKLGIEPGQAARQMAESRNIKMIANSLESASSCKADVITLLDVIEHFENPLQMLSRASSILNPSGCIVVLTGNADSTGFRLFSNNYWYCSIPEHVSFLSRRWFEWAATRLDMRVLACEHVSGENFALYPWLRDGTRNALFALVQRLRSLGIEPSFVRYLPVIGRAVSWRHCPWWLTAKDQIIVVMKKTD